MVVRMGKDLTLAGIHASILSIFIAFFSAYGIFVFGNIDDLEHRAFTEYTKINNIELTSKYRSPRHQFKNLLLLDSKSQYPVVLKQIWDISIIDLMNTIYEKKRNEINNTENGIKLLCNLTVLQNIYPYAIRIAFDTNGKVIDKKEIEKIEFHSLDDIRSWLIDIDQVLKNTLFIYTQRKGRINDLISAASIDIAQKMPPFESKNEFNTKYSSGDKEDLLRWRKNMASTLVNQFFYNIGETQKLFINTKKILDDYDLYKSRHIGKLEFGIGLILIFITFSSGVIFPILINKKSDILEIWIPVLFYFISFIYLFYKILFD